MHKQIYAVVVIYNKNCANSITCQNLAGMDYPDIHVMIYDNCTHDFANEIYCREQGWVYLGGLGNHGISKAYNGCIDYLKNQGREGVLCLFDDDTAVDKGYFQALEEATDHPEEKIFVPIIWSGGRILSPCRLNDNYKTHIFESEQEVLEYQGDDLSAINSGMAIDLQLFDDYRYDENIFLDGVDHHFIRDMKKRGNGIKVFQYICVHEFSGDSKPSVESAMSRFRIYAKDTSYILRGKKCAYWKLVGRRAVHLCLQYRKIHFFKTLIQYLCADDYGNSAHV